MKKLYSVIPFLIVLSIILAACQKVASWLPANEAVGSAELYYIFVDGTSYDTQMFETECYDLNLEADTDCVVYSTFNACTQEVYAYEWSALESFDYGYTGTIIEWDNELEEYIDWFPSTVTWYEDENGNMYQEQNDYTVYYFEAYYDVDPESCTYTSDPTIFECDETIEVQISYLEAVYAPYCDVQVTDWYETEIQPSKVTTNGVVSDFTDAELATYLDGYVTHPDAYWAGPYFVGAVDLYYSDGSYNIGNITDPDLYAKLMSNPSGYEIGLNEEGEPIKYRLAGQ